MRRKRERELEGKRGGREREKRMVFTWLKEA